MANQIAAGEVVQRPSSVVKELLENAIDAGATVIKLIAKDSGKTLIQVTDNGKGMSRQDARLCFERHATSKISRSEDLFHIYTKGFRGEALSSIAAVAQVELKTRQAQDELGTSVQIEASKVIAQEAVQCAEGTGFFVKNLFFNVPARRYFLKSDAIELRHMIDEFQRVALAHSDIEFHFMHNGAEVFHLPAVPIRQRIVHVLGNKYADKLVPVDEDTDIVSVHGFIGKPDAAKKSRGEQFLFINNRFIKSTYLNHAVTSAYQDLLPSGAFPLYLLYLEIEADQIDINIHPTKTEIKFQDERSVYAIIHAAVRRALGKFSIAPSLDFDQETSIRIEPMRSGAEVTPPTIAVNPLFNPFGNREPSTQRSMHLRGWFDRRSQEVAGWQDLLEVATQIDKKNASSEKLFHDDASDFSFVQHARKYILCTSRHTIQIIDQERAHQRVLYERFTRRLKEQVPQSQRLLFPLEITPDIKQRMAFHSCSGDLSALGFDIEEKDASTLLIHGIPGESVSDDAVSTIVSILDEALADESESSVRHDRLAWLLASRSAVKSGQMLTQPEMEGLFQNLMRSSKPFEWRNGKPTMIQFDNDKLDEYFR